jgi:hypothetical protein
MKFRNQGSISLAAIVVAAGVALGTSSASAADLGGNCCADLEERVAELEATTARKGNRKVSLQVYGRVSESVIWWNDGGESNTYVLENNLIKNVLGFRGSAKITSDWSAGYNLELQIRAYRSSSSSQLSLGTSNEVQIATYNTRSVALRYANWYLDSRTYGRITVGRSPDPMQGVATISLAEPDGFSGMTGPGYINNGFLLRRSGRTGNAGLSALSWGDSVNFRNGDGPASSDYSQTAGNVKYTSPFFLGQSKSSGFRVDAMWGMDDVWSVALRYAETWGQFRVAAGVGYGMWTGLDRGQCSTGESRSGSTADGTRESNVKCDSIAGSASVMHVPTGLFLSGGGTQIHDKNSQKAFDAASGLPIGANRAGDDGKASIWWLMGGWEYKLNSLGKTTFWGQYVEYNVGLGVRNADVQTLAAGDVLNSIGATALLAGGQAKYWGLGVSQHIDAAAMVLYAGFHNGSAEVTLQNQNGLNPTVRRKSNPIDDFQTFFTGATIRF